MRFEDAVAARRSVRAFAPDPVPPESVERAIALAITAPAPHHSSPWRFVLIEDDYAKRDLSRAMGTRWRDDLRSDGVPEEKIGSIVSRSHEMLTSTPLLVVCCADMTRAHEYPDELRRRAEWSLFAHTVGAALQTFMVALAADGIASCWISAPVFCGDVVREALELELSVEPHALVLVGYRAPGYEPRSRPEANLDRFIVRYPPGP